MDDIVDGNEAAIGANKKKWKMPDFLELPLYTRSRLTIFFYFVVKLEFFFVRFAALKLFFTISSYH